jgi:hypothetical protein
MKNLLAIAIVMLFTAFAAQAQNSSNCTATATGTFTFSVEAAIALVPFGNNSFELGGICPGCNKDFDNACAGWTVTGGPDCNFEAFAATTVAELPSGITVTGGWQYQDGEGWETYTQGNHDGLGNFFWIDNLDHLGVSGPTQFQYCVQNIAVDCFTPADNYGFTATLTVNYVCAN